MGHIDVSGDSFSKKYCLSAMSATVAESGKCYFVFLLVGSDSVEGSDSVLKWVMTI